MTENHHHVKVELTEYGSGAYVDWKVQCTAPEGSECRLWCDQDCETADENHGSVHELRDQGHCVRLEGWFDDQSMIPELYEGGNAPLRSGPITLHWQGEGYTWSYDVEAERLALARTIYASDWPDRWEDEAEHIRRDYLKNADALRKAAGVTA